MEKLIKFETKADFDSAWEGMEYPSVALSEETVYIKENTPSEFTFKLYNEGNYVYNEYTVKSGTTWRQFLDEHDWKLMNSDGGAYCPGYQNKIKVNEEYNTLELRCFDGGLDHIGPGVWYVVIIMKYFEDVSDPEFIENDNSVKIDDVIKPMDYMFW